EEPAEHSARPPSAGDVDRLGREPRRLAFLRAALASPPGADVSTRSGWNLDPLLAKVEAFAGGVGESGPGGFVAGFGLWPSEDAPSRAAHAALALARAAARSSEDDGEPWTVRVAVHVGQFLVALGPSRAEIALEAKQEVWPLLDSLLDRIEAGGIIVSEGALA